MPIKNQPFTFQSAQFNLLAAAHVHWWFSQHDLILGRQFPMVDHSAYVLDGSPLRDVMGMILQALGTGITHLDTERVNWAAAQIDANNKEKLECCIVKNEQLQLSLGSGKQVKPH